MRKGQGWRPLLDAHGLRALRRHCITHRHDSVIDITKWAQEYFQKPLSVNTIRRANWRCQLKLYHAKRKPYVNMIQKRHRVLWAKAHFIYIYIYAFSRRFYPKRLTLHSSYSFTFDQLLLSLGIEPMILALLAPCSTIWATGKLEGTLFHFVSKWKSVLWSDESKFDTLVGNHSSKASISDGMGVHKCIRYG